MATDRQHQITALYHAALERDGRERAAFLGEACAGDDALRREVESLLGYDDAAAPFLERPAIEEAASLMANRTDSGRDLAGRRIGVYQIDARIGAGGMGEVYRARDTKLGRDVAIKVLPAHLMADTDRRSRFEREARLLATLNHPHIGHVYGLEESDGLQALVMELVPGQTLAHLLADPVSHGASGQALPCDQALLIARQIADALDTAHEKGIVHRDLKPGNVMIQGAWGATPSRDTNAASRPRTPRRLDGDLVVKVLDFGLAKAVAGDASGSDLTQLPTITADGTRQGVILGTPAYMSPEQARGKPVDKRTDIWAFGCVLYETLTGRLAFAGETTSDTLAAILEREPDWNALPESTPDTIRHLLRRCLEKDPKRRLRDIGDARAAIDDPIAGRRDTPPVGVTRSIRQGPQLPWIVGTAVMALIASVALWLLWRGTRPIDRPLTRLVVDLGPEAIAGTRSTAVLSPDGTRIAFVARDPDGKPRLATRLLEEPSLTLLAGTENAEDPFFSPDGQWLGFFAGGQMKKVPVVGGTPVFLCDGVANDRGATWMEDGTIIVTAYPGSGLLRLPPSGGPLQLLKGTERGHWPQILPGGQAVLFTRSEGSGSWNVEVLSLQTGQMKVVARGGVSGRYLPSGHLVFVREATLYAVPFDLGRLEALGVPIPVADDVRGSGMRLGFGGNGTLLYSSGNAGLETVVWLDRAGKAETLVASPARYSRPTLSPDGRYLAIRADDSHWIHDLQRNTVDPIRSTTTRIPTQPVWAPDAKHLVIGADDPNVGLWWIRADGAGEPQSLLKPQRFVGPSSISRDRVAFHDWTLETGWDIWTLPIDTSDAEHPKPGTPEPYLRTTEHEYSAQFSPDGRWVAYAFTESGGYGVAVRPFKGPGGPWPIGSAASFEQGGVVVWSPSRRRTLYYLSSDLHVMEVAYSVEGDAFAAAKPRRWSDKPIVTRGFDVSQDGQRLVVVLPQGQPQNVQVTFLLNFFDELRRRLPTGRQ